MKITLLQEGWPGGWGHQGMSLTCGGLVRVPNLRVCKHLVAGVARAGEEERINVLPWYRLVGVAKTSSETQRRKSRAARKGMWPPRGTGTTVLTYPCPTASRVSVAVRGRARVTGKDGENGQNSGEMGSSSPWTRKSAPGCGDTLKALAGDQRPI